MHHDSFAAVHSQFKSSLSTHRMASESGMPEQETQGFSCKSIHPKLDVYVWDMDETLILLNSLLKSSYAEAFNGLKDVQKGVEIGKAWENLILQLCDDYFFYEQVKFGFCVLIRGLF